MSTIAEELARLQKAKSDFKDVIINGTAGSEEAAIQYLITGLGITEAEAAALVALDGTLDTYPEALLNIMVGAIYAIGYDWANIFYTGCIRPCINNLEAI